MCLVFHATQFVELSNGTHNILPDIVFKIIYVPNCFNIHRALIAVENFV